MSIFNLFSKRQKQSRGEVPDVYSYDEIPKPLRVQIIHILKEILGNEQQYNARDRDLLRIKEKYLYPEIRRVYDMINEVLCGSCVFSASDLCAKALGFTHHFAQHLADCRALSQQCLVLLRRNVIAFERCIQPVLRFSLFGIGEFADEVSRITSLMPGFGDISAYRARRPPNLIG